MNRFVSNCIEYIIHSKYTDYHYIHGKQSHYFTNYATIQMDSYKNCIKLEFQRHTYESISFTYASQHNNIQNTDKISVEFFGIQKFSPVKKKKSIPTLRIQIYDKMQRLP